MHWNDECNDNRAWLPRDVNQHSATYQYLAIRQYATSKYDVKQTVLPDINVTITA